MAGCFSTSRIDSLPVPVRFVNAVEVTDAATGAALEDATVYVANDEDPVVQVAWTDAEGRATVVQEYSKGTVTIDTGRFLGIPLGKQSELRYPTFEMLVARPGYAPRGYKFGAEKLGPRQPPSAEGSGRPLVVERDAPEPISLTASAKLAQRPRQARFAEALFAAPPPKRNEEAPERGAVNGGRLVRVGASPDEPIVACAARALGRDGARVLLVGMVTPAKQSFRDEINALAATCDDTIRADDATGDATGRIARTRENAARFAAHSEERPPGDTAPLLAKIDAALAQRKRVAVLAPVATTKALERALGDRGFHVISETWIEAW